jgi:tetratricopeptide (TPR) repeat protein
MPTIPPSKREQSPLERRGKFAALAGLFSAFACFSASACVNEYGTTRQGQSVHVDVTADVLRDRLEERFDRDDNVEWAEGITAAARTDPTPEHLNDLAVVLIRFGRPREAIALLHEIEKRSPGRGHVAANLGTAYELVGDNANALRWIREGIRRNPDDHEGTEWLHVRILEAKLDPARKLPTDGRSVLGLEFGNATMPARPVLPKRDDGSTMSMYDLGKALNYQLGERTDFLAPPDPVIAGLLLDWANLEMLAGTLENAVVLYDLADDYGSPQTALIARRRDEAERIIDAADDGKMVHSDRPCELCEPPATIE